MDSPVSWLAIVLLGFAGLLHCSHENIFNDENKLKRVLVEAMMNETWVNEMLEEERSQQPERWKLGAFPCPSLAPSDSIPTSVHRLRPADIKVVAAIGDSYSTARAGGGIRPFNMLFDYRGNSWSIGGDRDYDFQTTLPSKYFKAM
ncbi:phospholipase B1, membrane-associated [Elysia marginata]|uniref:Phospholipase B1, membrane-associated n=1 Tax=Elysia marginata TaxID=1093978 RepID=A0AAV4FB31_9GAST|nr:phospholipase B1, membrane-associated [Elysia marginata]